MSQQEMANGDDENDEVALRFRELCLAVNMDKPTMESAWRAYEETRMHYSLEGDSLHWLVCSLYVACRRNLSIRTVSGQTMSSNCVSLTKLLHEAKFSFISFLKKVDKWLQMNPNNEVLSEHISSLGRSFEVSTNVFKNYMEIFRYVFLDPDDPKYLQNVKSNATNPSRPHRGRRNRRTTCTPRDVFNFCWTFFIHAKGTQFKAISDELVSSFQLLLSVINLCYLNALNCDHRANLLNPTFPGLPEGWDAPGFVAGDISEHEIIGLLVKQKAGLNLSKEQTEDFLLQTRVFNIHNWTKFVQSLLDPNNDVLFGTERTLLLPQHFDSNFKAIKRQYEEYVLTEGDFDETVFLCDDVDQELGTPIKSPPPTSGSRHREIVDHLSNSQPTMPRTPLTNREYLDQTELNDGSLTPLSSAVQSSIKLRKILLGKKDKPSDKLAAILSECNENPCEEIESRLSGLCTSFMQEYVKPYGEIPASQQNIAESRSQLTRTLYYHLLEGIMTREKARLNGKGDLTALLKRDDFHSLLFACSVEIVLKCYQAQREFPWIIETMDIFPYYFYKVIELVIRAEESLPNQCIKHLNHIEEQILESLAWKSNSPVWVALEECDGIGPQCEEVNHSQHLDNSASSGLHPIGSQSSPLAHPRLKAVAKDDMGAGLRKSESSSAHDRFSSPAPGSAKRRLFPINTERKSPIAGSFPQSTSNASLVIGPSSPRGKGITLVSIKKNQTPENIRPKKTGSLALFFRKVYHLSGVRLRHLFGNLVIAADLRSKIWTCFEYSIAKKGRELIKDRHIDQLLMCSIYVMAKITQHDYSFQEIMRCYRNQPQANSNVYRSVLIHRASNSLTPSSDRPASAEIRSDSTLPSSTPSSEPSSPSQNLTPSGQQEERDDLIQFYNKVYVPTMRDFVKQFSSSGDATQLEVPISPMPLTRKTIQSPRKVAGNVYISPLRPKSGILTHGTTLEYSFQRSPAKQLREINSMMQKHHSPSINGKRHLAFSDDAEPEPKRPVSKRLQLVQAQRNGLQ